MVTLRPDEVDVLKELAGSAIETKGGAAVMKESILETVGLYEPELEDERLGLDDWMESLRSRGHPCCFVHNLFDEGAVMEAVSEFTDTYESYRGSDYHTYVMQLMVPDPDSSEDMEIIVFAGAISEEDLTQSLIACSKELLVTAVMRG